MARVIEEMLRQMLLSTRVYTLQQGHETTKTIKRASTYLSLLHVIQIFPLVFHVLFPFGQDERIANARLDASLT
jgi:hypothetical protein